MDASPRKARDVFLAAIKLPALEQEQYLREACADDHDLGKRVSALLQAQAEIGSFHEAPVRMGAQGVSESPGTVIGAYKLIEQLGEGGMGTVWMAQQTDPVKRVVALKLIKAGMDSKQILARFEAERQALALMDHPNIARVLDAGTTRGEPDGVSPGRPYFVMDLVKGLPITRYCDEHRLTPRQRLGLFIPVCQAVQHAHQKGIIHRDLKPSNVLVAPCDGQPVPKIIDFGVAKAAGQTLTEKTLVTGFGTIVGTLEYMSPEQAESNQLDIDTRSDVYALGVILYELLAGSPPFACRELEKAGMWEMLRVIREQEPTRPSAKLSTAESLPALAASRGTESAKLAKLVKGELDWIVMKALEKDRNRRYETANGFAMDVQRYLSDEPVLAGPPSAAYRLRKFARRNRSGLAVAGLVLFCLVLLGSVAGWAWRDRAARTRKAELERMARAAEQANHLERAVQRAELLQREGKHGEALAALERAQLLAREFEPSRPVLNGIDSLQGLLDAERQDLEFVARYEAIQREGQITANVQKNVLGDQNSNLKLREALKQYGIEVSITPPADAVARIQASRPGVQNQVVAALDECLCFVPSTDATSRRWFVDVLQEADSDTWRRKVRKAWLVNPQDASARSLWADYWYDWGVLHSDLRQYARAIRDFSKAAEIRPEAVGTWHNLAMLRLHSGDVHEYRRLCAELVGRFSKKDDADSKAFVTWTCVLAPGSVQDFQSVLDMAAGLAKQFPGSANNRLVHGAALYRSGRWKAALERMHESQEAPVRDLGWPGQELFLALACRRLGQVADVRHWLDAAVKWEQENQGAAWWARVLTGILRREAEALIQHGGDDTSPKRKADT